MRLVFAASGMEVKVGDLATTFREEQVRVTSIRRPHKPASSGEVTVTFLKPDGSDSYQQSFYPSVIGAEWIEREDRTPFPES